MGKPPTHGLPPLKDYVLSIRHGREHVWESDPPTSATHTAPLWNDAVVWSGVLYPPLAPVEFALTYRTPLGKKVATWVADPVVGEQWSTAMPGEDLKVTFYAPKTNKYAGELKCSFYFVAGTRAPLRYRPFWQQVGWWVTLPQHWVPEGLPLKERFDDGVDWGVEGLLYVAHTLKYASPPDVPAWLRGSQVRMALFFLCVTGVLASVVSGGAALLFLLAVVFFPLLVLLMVLSVLAMLGLGFPAVFLVWFGLTSPSVNHKLFQPFMRGLVRKVPLMGFVFLEPVAGGGGGQTGGGEGGGGLHQE